MRVEQINNYEPLLTQNPPHHLPPLRIYYMLDLHWVNQAKTTPDLACIDLILFIRNADCFRFNFQIC